MATKAKYGYDLDGRPLENQTDVILDYLLRHPGKEHAISHGQCEDEFGFTRLGARIWEIENERGITVSREDRKRMTRYPGITAEPTFYWIETEVAARVLKERRENVNQHEKQPLV